jgi:hypothetical protein
MKNVTRVPNFEKRFETGTSRKQSWSVPISQRGYVRVTESNEPFLLTGVALFHTVWSSLPTKTDGHFIVVI